MHKVGLNGLGRIGRQIFLQLLNNPKFKIVQVNELNSNLKNIAYMLKYDSTYGVSNNKYKIVKNKIIIENKRNKEVFFTHQKKINDIKWKKDISFVIDATGVDQNVINSNSFKKPIFFTWCPSKGIDKYIIPNVNDDEVHLKNHKLISTSICDAVAIAPILKLLNDNLNIVNGHVTTLHPWLNYQNLLDNSVISSSVPNNYWDEYSLGRSAITSIIPKTTTTINAVGKIIKNINNKISSFSYRVPTAIVSSAIISLNFKENINEKIFLNLLNKNFLQKDKVVHINYDPKVSIDYKNLEYACSLDVRFIRHVGKNINFIIWYDNEYGYVKQILKSIEKILKK